MKAPNMSPLTVEEAIKFFKDEPEGVNPNYSYDEDEEIFYLHKDEIKDLEEMGYEIKKRIGTKKIRWKKHSQTLTSNANIYHALRNDPLTCRERARLMGFPDDFEFVFLTEKDHYGIRMAQQTGQAVPIQFTTFFAKQILAHLKGEEFECSGERFLTNDLVEQNKKDYCKEYEYDKTSCKYCVLRHDCNIKEKWGKI